MGLGKGRWRVLWAAGAAALALSVWTGRPARAGAPAGTRGGPTASGARVTLPPPLPGPNRAVPVLGPAGPIDPGSSWPWDFPDPSVLPDGGLYYAYATEAGPVKVQTLVSPDLVHWTWLGDSLGPLPAWSDPGRVWAPSVWYLGGHYVMYYTTDVAALDRQCVSVATSRVPSGPFLDLSTAPLVCHPWLGGSIDPYPYLDASGAPWLAWKAQGVSRSVPAAIYTQRLTPDGTALAGPAQRLLTVSQPWEGHTVEAPAMVRYGGTYFLFYSGNDWWTSRYAEGFAVCSGPAGPCRKPLAYPLWSSHRLESGPGSAAVFSPAPGRWELAFHSWTAPAVGYPDGSRSLHLARLGFSSGRPVVTEG